MAERSVIVSGSWDLRLSNKLLDKHIHYITCEISDIHVCCEDRYSCKSYFHNC